MKSMTGYGRGEYAQNGFKVTVELSSVNRKQSDIAVYLPRELEPLESQIRDEINRRIARGRLTARVSWHSGDGRTVASVRLNTGLAKEFAKELRRLAQELDVPANLSLDLLARAPGVLQIDENMADASSYWPAVEKAVRKAIAALLDMRDKEGSHLAQDLTARLNALRKAVKQIQRQAPLVAKQYRHQLLARLENAGLPRSLGDDQRLLQEVVLFADRADISEELTRLQSHFQQFEAGLKSAGAVGRTLDFIAQEMYREVNTIGSKANDSLISRQVVILKTELEKIREQVQNVE